MGWAAINLMIGMAAIVSVACMSLYFIHLQRITYTLLVPLPTWEYISSVFGAASSYFNIFASVTLLISGHISGGVVIIAVYGIQSFIVVFIVITTFSAKSVDNLTACIVK